MMCFGMLEIKVRIEFGGKKERTEQTMKVVRFLAVKCV